VEVKFVEILSQPLVMVLQNMLEILYLEYQQIENLIPFIKQS